MAVLYRRKDDDSLVILKEINMLELTTQERQLALNEVCKFLIASTNLSFSFLLLHFV